MTNRFNILKTILKVAPEGKGPKQARQFTTSVAALGLVLATAACGTPDPKLPEGAIGFVGGFLGGVVADEPRAALAGRDILSRGGTAADAAAAMYFTMSVTLPSRAGLGGGGMCVVFDVESGTTQVLDFTAPQPNSVSASTSRPSAIPGNPRGFFALQARHGQLLWREVIAPAEQLARFGHPTSRAFARDLQAVGPALLSDPGARAMFAGKSGVQVAAEGETIEQVDLASTLGMLRARGVGPLYVGPYARTFVAAVNAAGGSLSVEDLRSFAPIWRDSVRVNVGNEVAHFAPPPAAASTVAAVMLALLEANDDYDTSDLGVRAHLISETGLRAFSDRETWLSANGQGTQAASTLVTSARIQALSQGLRSDRRTSVSAFATKPKNRNESPSSTGFSAADAFGNAVSCAVTMNSAFGTGRVAQGTGVLLAAAPDVSGRGPIGLAPMLLVNENSKEFRLAATASGGVAAPSALAGVVANMVLAGDDLNTALARPRVHLNGDPDITYYEPGLDQGAQSYLSNAGHRIQAVREIGLVNALYCPAGLPTTPETCDMAVDPRGVGLASGSMR